LTASGVWTAILLGHVTRASLSVLRFRQGKWQAIRVPITTKR
jgi:Na+-driven multidrug efflux pump